MVPVGGAIIFGPDPEIIARVAKRYAGRASISHVIDLFITLIGLGRSGLGRLKTDRIKCFEHFRKELKEIEAIRVMETPHNDVSLAIQLPQGFDSSLGSQLFLRNISGARVIEISGKSTMLEGIEFVNFGSHSSSSKWKGGEFCYLNVAAAVGSECDDIAVLARKLSKLLLA